MHQISGRRGVPTVGVTSGWGRRTSCRRVGWSALGLLTLLVASGLLVPSSHFRPSSSLERLPGGAGVVVGSIAVDAAIHSLRSGAGPAWGQAATCGAGGSPFARCTFGPPTTDSPTAGAAGPSYGWRPIPNHPGAQGQGPVLLANDTADGLVLLLGTRTGVASNNPADSQTWAFRSGNWSQLFPPASPAVCAASTLADDPADSGVLYFAGVGCRAADTTWLYRGGNWTNETSPVRPPARSSATMSFDTADGYVLLFGGANPSGPAGPLYLNDTWAFSGGKWVNLSAAAGTAPAPRSDAQQADDLADHAVILWGGLGSGFFNDTWAFHSGQWTHIVARGAPNFASYFIQARTTYDAADGFVLLVGATNATRGPYEFAYRYSGGNWSALASSGGPTDRYLPGLAYDARDREVVLFGGTNYAPQPGTAPQNDTWTFRGGVWTSWDGPGPAPRGSASLAYDAGDGYVVLFGGWVTPPFAPNSANQVAVNDTWSFRAGQWTELRSASAPSPRYGAGLVDDLADGYLVLFGGASTTAPYPALGDTWEFLNGSWSRLNPAAAPPNDSQPAMVYDGGDGYVLLYATTSAAPTWSFHAGLWQNRSSPTGPRPGAPLNPLVYDAADGYVLLFGTATSTPPYTSNQTWSYLSGNWTNRTSAVLGAPAVVEGAEMLDNPVAGGTVVLFTPGGATWTYSGGAWAPAFPAIAPPGRAFGSTTYDQQDGYGLLFGGVNTTNWNSPGYTGAVCPGSQQRPCGDSWAWSAGAGTALRASVAVTPSATDVGRPLQITSAVSGGRSPYAFVYSGLPPGCTSVNRSTWNCTPSAAGTFTIGLTVTDAAGNRTWAAAGLSVADMPSISEFVASPARVAVAGRTVLTVNVTGGTPPLSFNFSGLPSGCSSQTVPILPCYPSATGNFTVTVRVTDRAGLGSTASTSIAVTPVGGGGRPTVSAFVIAPNALTLGNTTTLSVVASGTGPLSYAYAGLPAGCASSNASNLSCRPATAGTFDIVVTVGEPGGGNVSVGTNVTVYPVGGGGSPSILAFVASPTSVVLGGSATLSVVARANTTLSYRYAGLPPGCASGNTSTLPCTPSATGVYRVQAVVSDPSGDSVGVFGTMTVVPSTVSPLAVAQFVAAPANLTLGQTLYLVVGASGGVPPVHYAYSGLPPGCATSDASAISCVPTHTGTFAVSVGVTDSASHRAQAVRTITVAPSIAPGPPRSHASSAFDLLTAYGGFLVVAVGFALGLAVTALASEAYRRRRLAAEGQELVRQMSEPADADLSEERADG